MITNIGTQFIGSKLVLKCVISPFSGTVTWAKDGAILTVCTPTLCTVSSYGNYTIFSFASTHINVTFYPVDSSIDGVWECTHSTLGSDGFNVTAMIESQNSSTTTEPSTDKTTPVETSDGSKDKVKIRNIEIGVGISTLIVIIMIIIAIVLAQKRGNKLDNAKNPKLDNSNKTLEPTVNKIDTPENMAMQHSKPWDHAVNTPRNPEHVYMQNDHHVDYDRRYNSGNPEHVSMPNEYHVDYDRRNYSGNPENEPQPILPPADYDRRNYSGNPEHEPLPSLPPADYDRRNDHDNHY